MKSNSFFILAMLGWFFYLLTINCGQFYHNSLRDVGHLVKLLPFKKLEEWNYLTEKFTESSGDFHFTDA